MPVTPTSPPGRRSAKERMSEAEVRHAVGEYDEARWQEIRNEQTKVLGSTREELSRTVAEIERLTEVQALVECSGGCPTGARAGTGAAGAPHRRPRPRQPRAQRPRPPPPTPPTDLPLLNFDGTVGAAESHRAGPSAGAPRRSQGRTSRPPARSGSPPRSLRDARLRRRSTSWRSSSRWLPRNPPPSVRAAECPVPRRSSASPRRWFPSGQPSSRCRASPGPTYSRRSPWLPYRMSPRPRPAGGKDRPSQQAAPKTLKCGECGTLNRPTEWYCERCGAELAAL